MSMELTDLKGLEKYANDVNSLRQLQAIKKEKKNQIQWNKCNK